MDAKAPHNHTYDCPPTLTDRAVIDFCRNDYLVLPGIVPADVNERVVDHVDHGDGTYEPTSIMTEDWYVAGVLQNPQAAGAARSLPGQDFTLPAIVSNHRGTLPSLSSGGWHRDGGPIYTPALEYLQVFYLPEDCTPNMGPTEALPGSHFKRTKATTMSHYGSIAGTASMAGPAGTIIITVYAVWHRRTGATSGQRGKSPFRNLLKYNSWRTTHPRWDWVTDAAFDISRVGFDPPAGAFEQLQGGIAAARMSCWLAGIEDQFVRHGGQGWPIVPTVPAGANQMDLPDALREVGRRGHDPPCVR